MYNLSILCVDGETIYGIIARDKQFIRNFMAIYDHEGSSITLTKKEGEYFTEIPYDQIYNELKGK
jgi:hypothetical protein